MRYKYYRWLPLLFAGSLISSCTCRQQVEQVAGSPTQRPAGFHVAGRRTVIAPTVLVAPTLPPAPTSEITPGPGAEPEGTLPSDFPADVTLMKDAEITGVQRLPADARAVLVRTEQEKSQVYDFYEQDLREKGWTLEQNYQGKEQSFLGFRRGNTILNLTVTEDPKNPGKRMVMVMYQEDQPPDFGDF
ncbi:MAG: hypothetical protein HY699_15640 [Deltaproteobacteria bacterium]|nr:hypothetical protein [Deltaproteobacteria bacterium]